MGKAYLKINLLVKTPLHRRSMEVRRSGLWAPDLVQIHLIGIRDWHQITAVSVIKRLGLYEFTPWSRDLVSVVRIRESPYYRGFFKIKYTRIFSGRWEVSVLERCPYRQVRLYDN